MITPNLKNLFHLLDGTLRLFDALITERMQTPCPVHNKQLSGMWLERSWVYGCFFLRQVAIAEERKTISSFQQNLFPELRSKSMSHQPFLNFRLVERIMFGSPQLDESLISCRKSRDYVRKSLVPKVLKTDITCSKPSKRSSLPHLNSQWTSSTVARLFPWFITECSHIYIETTEIPQTMISDKSHPIGDFQATVGYLQGNRQRPSAAAMLPG